MERANGELTALDALFLQRAYELALRGVGNTAPNPAVGAVVALGGRLVGEGYHHYAGAPHAESNALHQAGSKAHGATVYVSLEPCKHSGRTPPCTNALADAGVARVVMGTIDPSGNGGASQLRERGIDVTIVNDPIARDLVEDFARSSTSGRPYLAVKMAMSLDGAIARKAGVSERLSSEHERQYVRELRVAYDAVLVGAETIRIDDPQLTVRPLHDRQRAYIRIVACQDGTIPKMSQVFASEPGYANTILLVPAGLHDGVRDLCEIADVMYVGPAQAVTLDLSVALKDLRTRGICSILCEGGPRLTASLIAAGLADRFYWAIAPIFLHNEQSVPVLSGADLSRAHLRTSFDRMERVGDDVVLSGRFGGV